MKRLTEEQERIASIPPTKEVTVINAVAGSGKTSALLELARRHEEKGLRVTFLCFNASTATDVAEKIVSERKTVEARTFHSLAMGFERPSLTPVEHKAKTVSALLGGVPLHEAEDALAALRKYFAHDVGEITWEFVRSACPGVSRCDKAARNAKYLLAKMEAGDLAPEHDKYMKDFCTRLKKGLVRIPSHTLIADETQDFNSVQIQALCSQKRATRVLAGDDFQQLYSFRDAVSNILNRLSSSDKVNVLPLSTTFRFGELLAGAVKRISGNAISTTHAQTAVRPPLTNAGNRADCAPHGSVILCATNATVILEGCNAALKNVRAEGCILPSKIDKERTIARDFERLDAHGNPSLCQHRKVRQSGSGSFNQLTLASLDSFNGDGRGISRRWHWRLAVASHFGPAKYREAIERLASWLLDSYEPSISIMTVHQSKGLEFPTIVIGEDIPAPKTHTAKCLVHVGLTRATEAVFLNRALWNIYSSAST